MKTVLITRPHQQAKELAQFLENAKFRTFIEPLFAVEKLPISKISLPISAAIITSANACDAVINSNLSKNIKVFSVGKKTSQKLFEAGFKNIVFSGENSAESLQNLIAYEAGKILYFHGSVMSVNFAKKFKNVENIFAYKTHEMKNFSPELLQFSHQKSFHYILLFSQNSAEIFFKLAEKHNLLEYFKASQILVLSEKILIRAKEIGFKKVKIFTEIPILKKFYD